MLWLWQLVPAQAADGSSAQVPGALSWIELQDSRGISVWNYELSLDRGGVTSPGKIIWSFVIDLLWGIYRSCVVVAIWFLDWALSFQWLAIIATPVLAIGASLQVIVDRFGVAPLFATAAALIAATWMAKGKWALGIFELFASLVIAALAVGAFSNPVEKVAGDSGLIMDTRDVGLDLAAGMANNGNVEGDTDAMRQTVTATMVDTFIRIPTQMINFGAVLDGGGCEGAYDDVVRGGPYGSGDDIRNAIEGCDENLGEAAANPGMGQAVSALILSPAASFVMIFALMLAGAVMLAAAYALYQALRLIVTVILAILPGSARGALFQTVADLAMALVTLVFAVVFCSSYLIFIQGVFDTSSSRSQGVMATFFLVDVMLVIGIVLFWKGRKKLRRAADRLAAALATRPGAGPTVLPARQKMNPTDLYYKGRMAAQAGGVAGRGVGALGRGALAAGRGLNNGAGALGGWIGRNMGGPVAAGAAAGAGAGGAGGALQLLAGSGGAAGSARGGSSPSGPGGGGGGAAGAVRQRVASTRGARKVGGKLLAIGGQAAAAYLTGGASAALQAGGQAATAAAAIQTVKSARRVALAGSLATKALPAGASTSSGSSPLALNAGRSTGGGAGAPAVAASAGAAAAAAAGTVAAAGSAARSQRALPSTTAGSPTGAGARGGSSAAAAKSASPTAGSTSTARSTGGQPTGSTAEAKPIGTKSTGTRNAGAKPTVPTSTGTRSSGATAAGARTGSTPAPRAAGATASTKTTASTSTTQPVGPPAGRASAPKTASAPAAPVGRATVGAVSGEVIAAPATKPATSDGRAARLRAELAARRAATSHTQRATGRAPGPRPGTSTD